MIKKRQEESLLLRMILVGERLRKRREIICKKLGISTQQWLILLHIARDPNIPFIDFEEHKKDVLPKEIAATLGTSKANITILINGLLEKNLINEEQDSTDKRKKRLKLSADGVNLLKGLQMKREQLNSSLFAAFKPNEMEKMLQFVEKFITVLEKNPNEI
jgi:DNA-binding MarR family transcriptional regulator